MTDKMMALFIDEFRELPSTQLLKAFPRLSKPITQESTLHGVMAPRLVKTFAATFDEKDFEVTTEVADRWVIAQHRKEKWWVELLCECQKEDLKTELKGFKREATLRLPPDEDGHPGILFSCFFPESRVRVPLWILEWKVNQAAIDAMDQAFSYGFQALRHNRSVLRHFDRVRTSILNHQSDEPTQLQAVTWEITVQDPPAYKFQCPAVSLDDKLRFPEFVQEVHDWCASEVRKAIEKNRGRMTLFRGIRWFPALVFPVADHGYTAGAFQPGSYRSTIFKCTKGGKDYWAKYLIKEACGFEALMKIQTEAYRLMQTKLDAMHKDLKGMLPFRETYVCSRQVHLEITQDIGQTNPCGGTMTERGARKFIFRMLAMTQLNFRDRKSVV